MTEVIILSFPGVSFPEGGMGGGGGGGASRGFDIAHSLSRHRHVTTQTPNIIVVQFRGGTVTIQAVCMIIIISTHNNFF